MLNKMSPTQNDKYCMISFICGTKKGGGGQWWLPGAEGLRVERWEKGRC